MIYDAEDLMLAIRDYLKSNLNTVIASINTEKGDSLLEAVTADNNHYLLAGEVYDIPNHPFVQISIAENVEIGSNENDYLQRLTLVIEHVMDNPKKPNTYYKSLRYMRALLQTLINFESSANEVGDAQITGAIPVPLTAKGRDLVVSGVIMSIVLC